jgi:hypothetical protein
MTDFEAKCAEYLPIVFVDQRTALGIMTHSSFYGFKVWNLEGEGALPNRQALAFARRVG